MKIQRNMIKLTNAEEQIMLILWDIKEGFIKDIIDKIPEPKPHYNTVSTIIRILEDKGMVDHKSFGKTHQYFPILMKEDYSKTSTQNVLNKYFNNSAKCLVSFFVKEKDISIQDLESILNDLKKNKL